MKWEVVHVDESSVKEKYHLSTLLARVIAASNLNDEQIHELLNPGTSLVPSKAECIQRVCERLKKAKENGEKVFVGGDYDADGICATAIMKDTLDCMGIPNGYYLPDRFKEGYGLKPSTVELAAQKGYQLILTVDNGVKAFDAIKKAKELGLEMIVTDHHQIEEAVDADLVVHPDYMEERYAYLSGAGVAMEIAMNLLGIKPMHVALAAVASIGDVMPLWRETRTIVQLGLDLISKGAVPALNAMMFKGAEVNPRTISFQIVPKLNSVGRMNDISNVNTLVPFLLCRNSETIARYAGQLNTVNDRRRALSAEMVKKAEKMVTEDDFQVLYDPDFHEGICGIVAGKIADSYHKPALVLAGNENLVKGSGRSIPGFDLFGFLSEGFEELEAFGGHEQAVGLSVKKENLDGFIKKVKGKMAETPFTYEEKVRKAIFVTEQELDFDAIADLKLLEPIAREMAEPMFALEHPEVVSLKEGPKVSKYRFLDQVNGIDGVLFPFRGQKLIPEVELACGTLSINRWRDRVNLQMDIEYLR